MQIDSARRLGEVEEYYFSRKLREIADLNKGGADIFNLGIGNPDLAPHPDVVKTLVRCASLDTSHGYQGYRGLADLREAISSYYSEHHGVGLNSDAQVLPLIGSKEGIMHIAMAFLNAEDSVLVPNPGYPTYRAASNLTGANIIEYDLNESTGWQIDLDCIENQDLDRVKLMWINYPNMPTGVAGNEEILMKLIALARKNKFIIVNDNPYSQILTDSPRSIFNVEGSREVCLELGSLSKSHNMAGWRIGWVVGNSDWIDIILRFKSNMDSGMFLSTQEAASTALRLPKSWYVGLNEVYVRRKLLAEQILQLLDCRFEDNQQGMFLWAKIPDFEPNAEVFADKILDKCRVFVPPGSIFGSNGNRFIRISLCSPEEKLNRAIDRIKEVEL